MPESDFQYIAMVGLFYSNGWATTFEGRPASFIALEWFADQRYSEMLVQYETAHSFHALSRTGEWPEHHVGLALFEEGLATLVSAELSPNLPEDEYLWFGPWYAD